MPFVTSSAKSPPPFSDLAGMALLSDRSDFFSSPISPISSSMRGSLWIIRAGATATAAAVDVGAVTIFGFGAGASGGGATTAGFSSSAAVISHAGFLNRLYGGRTETDRVLKISASLPRSRLMSSRPSCSEWVLYVFTFIVLRLPERRSEHWGECHSAKSLPIAAGIVQSTSVDGIAGRSNKAASTAVPSFSDRLQLMPSRGL